VRRDEIMPEEQAPRLGLRGRTCEPLLSVGAYCGRGGGPKHYGTGTIYGAVVSGVNHSHWLIHANGHLIDADIWFNTTTGSSSVSCTYDYVVTVH